MYSGVWQEPQNNGLVAASHGSPRAHQGPSFSRLHTGGGWRQVDIWKEVWLVTSPQIQPAELTLCCDPNSRPHPGKALVLIIQLDFNFLQALVITAHLLESRLSRQERAHTSVPLSSHIQRGG